MYGHAVAELVAPRRARPRRAGRAGRGAACASCSTARPRTDGRAGHRAPVGVGLRRQPSLGRLVPGRVAGRPVEGREGRADGGRALRRTPSPAIAGRRRTDAGFAADERPLRGGVGRLRRAGRLQRGRAGLGHRRRHAGRRGRGSPRRASIGAGRPERPTWTDDVRRRARPAVAAARTVEALLPVLVSDRRRRRGRRVRPAARRRRVRRHASARPACTATSPSFDAGTYWRGPAWPQLTYLLWLAAHAARAERRRRRAAPAQLVAGAWQSGFAEYWDPDTGDGHGASPQSWTALAAVVA